LSPADRAETTLRKKLPIAPIVTKLFREPPDPAGAQVWDDELAQLAAKVQTTQADFAAGKMSDHDLIIILIAIAALILIIVAVR